MRIAVSNVRVVSGRGGGRSSSAKRSRWRPDRALRTTGGGQLKFLDAGLDGVVAHDLADPCYFHWGPVRECLNGSQDLAIPFWELRPIRRCGREAQRKFPSAKREQEEGPQRS